MLAPCPDEWLNNHAPATLLFSRATAFPRRYQQRSTHVATGLAAFVAAAAGNPTSGAHQRARSEVKVVTEAATASIFVWLHHRLWL